MKLSVSSVIVFYLYEVFYLFVFMFVFVDVGLFVCVVVFVYGLCLMVFVCDVNCEEVLVGVLIDVLNGFG